MTFFSKVFRSRRSINNGIMKDFCDGNAFKKHMLYSKDPQALQIQLYYDDIDVCNPIGSKSVIHKLGM